MKLPRPSLVLAAAFGASLMAASAQAFTIENYGSSNSGGSAARLNDETPQRPEYGTIGPSNGPKIQQGNTTFQFGGTYQGGGFNQRYDSSRMFDPIARDR